MTDEQINKYHRLLDNLIDKLGWSVFEGCVLDGEQLTVHGTQTLIGRNGPFTETYRKIDDDIAQDFKQRYFGLHPDEKEL